MTHRLDERHVLTPIAVLLGLGGALIALGFVLRRG